MYKSFALLAAQCAVCGTIPHLALFATTKDDLHSKLQLEAHSQTRSTMEIELEDKYCEVQSGYREI